MNIQKISIFLRKISMDIFCKNIDILLICSRYFSDIFRIFLGYLISILYRRYFSDIFCFGYRDIKYRYYIHFWMISGYYLDISGYFSDIILILYPRYRYNIGYRLATKYQYYIQNIQKIWILYP